MSARLLIKWSLDFDTRAYGVTGVDSETVPVDDLVRWAKRRRRDLRRAIREQARLDAAHRALMDADPVVKAAKKALRESGDGGAA